MNSSRIQFVHLGFALLLILFIPSISFADAKVRVMIFDETESAKLPSSSEVWIRGTGSWWIGKESKFGATVKDVPVPLNRKVDMAVFPDGRGGVELKIPFKLTSDMCTNACVRDAIRITFSDSNIEVFGLPFKAASGKLEQDFPRGR